MATEMQSNIKRNSWLKTDINFLLGLADIKHALERFAGDRRAGDVAALGVRALLR
jgi:hypothetical protein